MFSPLIRRRGLVVKSHLRRQNLFVPRYLSLTSFVGRPFQSTARIDNIDNTHNDNAQQDDGTYSDYEVAPEDEDKFRKVFAPTVTAIYLLISSLLVGGVLLVDNYCHNSSQQQHLDIPAEYENATTDTSKLAIITRYWKEWKSDVQKFPLLYGLLSLNTAVFLLTRRRVSHRIQFLIERNCTLSVQNTLINLRPHTLITVAFTHFAFWHFALNMCALYTLGPLFITYMGTPTFLAFYLGAAVSSSLGSLIWKILIKNYKKGTVGASGALFALLGAAIALLGNDTQVHHPLFPSITFDARMIFPVVFLGETISNLVQKRVRIDTVMHMTGAIFGYVVFKSLSKQEHHINPRTVTYHMRDHFYSGQVVQFRKHGYGTLIDTAYTYNGDFKTDKFDGYGKLVMNKQVVYEGHLERGMPHGKGRFSSIDSNGEYKTVLEGEFKNGEQVREQ